MTPVRLHILAEGQTEENFVNNVLRDHLSLHGIATSVSCISQKPGARSRTNKGGWNDYAVARESIYRFWRESGGADCWFTTMVDLYRIPANFPGIDVPSAMSDCYERVSALENAFEADIRTDGLWRFIPYIQLHEFEALIFADPARLDSRFPVHDEAIKGLMALSKAERPEAIDRDNPPSKRLIAAIPEYGDRKAHAGPLVAGKIGLDMLRQRCPHFGQWLARLEALA
ncbi:MAG: DUF4276 family protein [Alphaproteobacteria bacterium]